MAERPLRRTARLIPVEGLREPAGSDQTTPQDEAGLAQLAALSGVPLANAAVSGFLRGIDNPQLAAVVRASRR